MSTTTPVATRDDRLDDRLDRMAAQLDELTEELRRQRALRETWGELAGEIGGLGAPTVAALTERLAELEERGYLSFARGGAGVLDRIVTNFDDDDVAALGDNVVLILETVKEMTQPEIMLMLQRTAHVLHEPGAAPGATPSVLRLLRDLRDPDVRRGLGRLLTLLRSLGATAET